MHTPTAMAQFPYLKDKFRRRPPTELRTPRILLRRYRPGDGISVYHVIQQNYERLSDSFPRSVAQVTDARKGEKFVQNKLDEWRTQRAYSFGIWHLSTGQYVGQVSVRNLKWKIARAELGYYLSYEFEGQGLMTEAVQAVIPLSFDCLRLRKLIIRTFPTNTRSRQLAETCGFRQEGLIRNEFRKADDSLSDVCYYGLTLEDYQRVIPAF